MRASYGHVFMTLFMKDQGCESRCRRFDLKSNLDSSVVQDHFYSHVTFLLPWEIEEGNAQMLSFIEDQFLVAPF